jgi:glucans biosynthesis protein
VHTKCLNLVELLAVARHAAGVQNYRAMFDLKPANNSARPVTLRLFLRADGQPLIESRLYEWIAPTVP